MAKYTREDVRKILAGLASGKPARPRPMMSDAAFAAMYDPQKSHEGRMLEGLARIEKALYAE